MFNLSLRLGVLPREWKDANVVPVYKKGQSDLIVNYRPVSLLNIAEKLLERCIFEYIYPCKKPLITDSQHGFMKFMQNVSS